MRLGRFTEADVEAVRERVAAAELLSGGEIVTYIVAACDDYPEARWRGAALGAVLGVAISTTVYWLLPSWGSSLILWGLLPSLLGLAGGAWLAEAFEPLRRVLVSRPDLERRSVLRAEAAFLEEEVFATRDRTGILLFIALFERRAIVLGDEGINRAVEAEHWEGIVTQLVAGIRAGRARDAVLEAIDACGQLLEEHEVERRPDDTDELPDEPRFRER